MLISAPRKTRSPALQGAYELDMYVLEYVCRPVFWVMGTSILAWWIAMMVIANRPHGNGGDAEPTHTKKGPIQPYFTRWLIPYMSSRFRKAFIILACLALGFLEVLEGYWMVLTGWRFASKFFRLWPAWLSTPLWTHAVYTLSAAFLMLCVVAATSLAAVIFLFHIAFFSEISLISPIEHHRVTTLESQDASETDKHP